jgi:hypothetical protein
MLKLVDITRIHTYDAATHLSTQTLQIAIPWKTAAVAFLLGPAFIDGFRTKPSLPASVTNLYSVPTDDTDGSKNDGL